MAKKATVEFDPKTYAYPACRMQHDWKFHDGTIESKSKLAFQSDRCTRCTARKISVISMRQINFGQLARPSRIIYPDDYQVIGGMDKAGKGKLRMRHFLSQLEGGAS